MNEIRATAEFEQWFQSLKDQKAKNIILARLRRATTNDFGDCGPIGNGASEMRIHYGPGYRVYFFRHKEMMYVLLGGGTKQCQQADIKKMIFLMNIIKRGR